MTLPRTGLARYLRLGAGAVVLAVTSACGGGGTAGTSSSATAGLVPAAVATPASASVPLPTRPSALATPAAATTAPVASLTPAQAAAPVPVTLHFALPPSIAQSVASRSSLELQSLQRKLQYVSASNVSIKIIVTPIGGSGSTFTGNCTTGSCTASFTATPGPNTIAITLTDGAGGTGNTLASYTTTSIVQPSTINTLAFTASPIVDHVSLSLASNSVTAGTATNDALTVNAMDKDSNTIVGSTPYVDANGNPVSLLLSVNNSQAGGRGTVSIQGPLRIVSPNQSISYAHYDGNWLDHADIAVTATSALGGSLNGTTLSTQPHVVEYSEGLYTPQGIAVGPGGNLWISDYFGNQVSVVTTSGTLVAHYYTGAYQSNLTLGPDGNMWISDYAGGHIIKMKPNGSFTTYGGYAYPVRSVVGPDGNIWTANLSYGLARINPSNGSVTTFGACQPSGVAFDPSANLWVSCFNTNAIVKLNLSGKVLGTFTYTYPYSNSGVYPTSIIFPADGNLYFITDNGYYICKSTLNGSITVLSTGITANAGIKALTVGPDGNIWFVESNTGYIGKLTLGGSVTEYTTANGLPAGAQPQDLIVGPDGNIWFTDNATSELGKLIL